MCCLFLKWWGSRIYATSNVGYLDVGELFNVYDCFKMQISNKGRGVIISLLNGHFWYNSAFAFVPGMYLTKEKRSDLNSCASHLYPTLLTQPGSSWSSKDLFCILKWELLFGYVILKDPISLGIYCTPFGTHVWAWGKLVCRSHRHCTETAPGCPSPRVESAWSASPRARGWLLYIIYIGGISWTEMLQLWSAGKKTQLHAAHSCAHVELNPIMQEHVGCCALAGHPPGMRLVRWGLPKI